MHGPDSFSSETDDRTYVPGLFQNHSLFVLQHLKRAVLCISMISMDSMSSLEYSREKTRGEMSRGEMSGSGGEDIM